MQHIVTRPVWTDALSVADAKFHCRIEDSFEDSYVLGLIGSAFSFCEKETGRCLFTQTREVWLPSIYDRYLRLSDPPLQSVESIKYYDTAEADQTMATSDYRVYAPSEGLGIVEFKRYPSTFCRLDGVRIRYVAGYEEIPEDLRTILYLLIAYWHENRTAESERSLKALEYGVDRMLHNFKVFTETVWI